MDLTKNRIKIILKERGIEEFKPTDKLLEDIAITRRSFFLVLDNKGEPTFGQSLRFAKWLNISLYDLYENEELIKVNI